jgi:hypothetical protein
MLATDSGSPELESEKLGILVVMLSDANDNAPEFDQESYAANVTENVDQDRVLVTLNADDKDSGDNGNVVYGINEQGATFGGLFVIDSETGALSTNITGRNCTIEECFDRETTDEYVLLVTATDMGGNPKSNTARVVVTVLDDNDHQPVIQGAPYDVGVPENKKGAIAFTVVATDDDIGENKEIEYAISTAGVPFEINAKTGVVRTTRELDRETEQNFTFEVSVMNPNFPDSDVVRADAVVHVTDLNDNAPTFVGGSNIFFVLLNESSERGIDIYEFEMEDKDLPPINSGTYTFRIVEGNDDFLWQLTEDGKLRVSSQLDFETQQRFQLAIVVSDTGTPALTTNGTVYITVADSNDNAPTFNSSKFEVEVSESTALNTPIIQVVATEQDEAGGAAIL